MKRKLKWIALGIGAVPLLAVSMALHYYLPSTRKVYVVDTEVKRMDVVNDPTGRRTRDVRYIVTRDVVTGKTHMYRNEDIGWPPYFKFDSGQLVGDAMNIKQTQPNATVLVTYYGWRIPVFSLYPNVTDLRIVDPEYAHIPWFNLFFFASLFGTIGYFTYKVRKVWKTWAKRREERRAAQGGDGDGSAEPAPEATKSA